MRLRQMLFLHRFHNAAHVGRVNAGSVVLVEVARKVAKSGRIELGVVNKLTLKHLRSFGIVRCAVLGVERVQAQSLRLVAVASAMAPDFVNAPPKLKMVFR